MLLAILEEAMVAGDGRVLSFTLSFALRLAFTFLAAAMSAVLSFDEGLVRLVAVTPFDNSRFVVLVA
jgi:hypothetical protein